MEEAMDHSFVLWAGVGAREDNEPSSPVLFKGIEFTAPAGKEEKSKEDLYLIYEQLTQPFEELTFKDFARGIEQQSVSLSAPTYSVAVSNKAAPLPASNSSPPPRRRAASTDFAGFQSPRRSLQLQEKARSPRTRQRQPVRGPIAVEHGTKCHICHTGFMIVKTRCLVCGKVYCRSCVKQGMGSMLEGRKCRSCLGHAFSQRYIARAGKGWWISHRVKRVELRWARKKPRDSCASF